MSLGRRVAAYHPEVLVRRGDAHFLIRADLDDWYPPEEVVANLGSAVGASTAGELVQKILTGLVRRQDARRALAAVGCGSLSLERAERPVDPERCTAVLAWGDQIPALQY